MRKKLGRVLVALLVVVLVVGAAAWWCVGRIDVERLAPDLYVLTGIGGNVGVLVTEEGVVVVDTMTFERQGEAILARIRELSDRPIAAILNTHYHLDHTHGNPAFPPGTKVVSTAETLRHLQELDAEQMLPLEFDRVIPGHGPVSDRAGWRAFQGFMTSLWTQTEEVVGRGGSLDDALRTVDLERFALRPLWFTPNFSRDFVVRRAYEEAAAARSR